MFNQDYELYRMCMVFCISSRLVIINAYIHFLEFQMKLARIQNEIGSVMENFFFDIILNSLKFVRKLLASK